MQRLEIHPVWWVRWMIYVHERLHFWCSGAVVGISCVLVLTCVTLALITWGVHVLAMTWLGGLWVCLAVVPGSLTCLAMLCLALFTLCGVDEGQEKAAKKFGHSVYDGLYSGHVKLDKQDGELSQVDEAKS